MNRQEGREGRAVEGQECVADEARQKIGSADNQIAASRYLVVEADYHGSGF
jgi:hypothetical protein